MSAPVFVTYRRLWFVYELGGEPASELDTPEQVAEYVAQRLHDGARFIRIDRVDREVPDAA
jgi:hypothetical protein